MFTIEMLPAERGDCLWVTYGEGDDLHYVIVDAGPNETKEAVVPDLWNRIQDIGAHANCIELLVITHVDIDHIQGVVQLLAPAKSNRFFRDIWFNGYDHLVDDGILGGVEGERLTELLERDPKRWNRAFRGHAVVVEDDAHSLPQVNLPGGMVLTLLSPTRTKLARMEPRWKKEVIRAGLVPGKGAPLPKELVLDGILGGSLQTLAKSRFTSDPEEPNGSSIAFIAEYDGKRALFGADAHINVLIETMKLLGDGPHELDAIKLPHHGSRKNLNSDFVKTVNCKKWLFSSNGSRFHHPNEETIARIVCGQTAKPTLYFNYLSEDNEVWQTHREQSRYKAVYPRSQRGGLKVKL